MKRLSAMMAALILGCALPSTVAQACDISSPTINLGTISSYAIGTTTQTGSGSAGLSCDILLAAATNHYVHLKVETTTGVLTGPEGNTLAFVTSLTPGGPALPVGTTQNLSSTSLVSLFSGTNDNVQLYVRTTPKTALRTGTYKGSVTLRWHYSVCSLGVGLCLSYSSSPGYGRPNTLGAGTAVTVAIEITVANDCFITAPDIAFGTAPLVSAFPIVTREMEIRCTFGSAYTVGLDDGRNALSGVRRMRSGTNYLNYEIYKSSSLPDRWGSIGSARRSSATANDKAGEYDSVTKQKFSYQAAIDATQPNRPAGTYSDIITVDVAF